MKDSLIWRCFMFFLLLLCFEVKAQDTSHVQPDSSRSFVGKVHGFYKKQYYRFYGRFVSHKINYDTSYIRKYREYIVASVSAGYPYLSYNITSPGGKGTTDYLANISNVLGFKFGYKNVGFGFSFQFKSALENADRLTSTSYSAFNFRIQTNRFNHAFAVSAAKGLTDVSSDKSGGGYIKRDDILIYNLSYDFIWNLHWKKYSYVAPRTYSQHQLKSMAGFLVKSGMVINQFKADSFIINPPQRMYYEGFRDVNDFSGVALEVAPGIGGNLVISKSLYFSNLLFIGMDYYMYQYKRSGYPNSYKSSSVQLFFDIESSIGYQSEHVFAGVQVKWNGFYNQIMDATMLWYNAYAGLTAGYRFKAPKPFVKAYDFVFPY